MRGMISLLSVLAIGAICGETRAQVYNPYNQFNTPGMVQPGQFFAPNYYNRANQPLSPYLNLLRPNNPAVNFYYGVRPGLKSGGATPFATTPNFNPFAPRAGFVPFMERLEDNTPDEFGFNSAGVPPTGHPVMYNNFSNYGGFGVPGQRSAGGQQMGGSRMMGTGATPQPPGPKN